VARLRDTVERELKLTAGEEFVLSHALDGEVLDGRTFVSTYHDTQDYRLAACGVTLRHRVEHQRQRLRRRRARDTWRGVWAQLGKQAAKAA
jgi:hypothetical protein